MSPGGKIAFYQGKLNELRLNEDEIAFLMGHEMAHAAREHLRSQLGRATGIAACATTPNLRLRHHR